MCLVSINLSLLSALFATVQTNTTHTTLIITITTRSLFFSHNYSLLLITTHNLFVSTNTYSLDLYTGELQTTKATLHKADWITTDCRQLCPALLLSNTNSPTNVIEVEGSRSCLLENSIATACIYAFSCLSASFSLILVVIGLFGSCSMYLLVCILFTLLVVCSFTFISCWCCWWFTCNKLVIVVATAFVYCS